jgi:hypothetical protein
LFAIPNSLTWEKCFGSYFGEEISATLGQYTPKSMPQCNLMAPTDPLKKIIKEQNKQQAKGIGLGFAYQQEGLRRAFGKRGSGSRPGDASPVQGR